jgi:hypothetical protein
MSKAVVRGQARKEERVIAFLGVYEKAFRKGHKFFYWGIGIGRNGA